MQLSELPEVYRTAARKDFEELRAQIVKEVNTSATMRNTSLLKLQAAGG
jgi:hypothetical protein